MMPGHSVGDGFGPDVVGLVPVTRPAMQLRDQLRFFVKQSSAENVGEQVVVPVPVAAVVERHQEQVGPVQLLQHRLASGTTGDGVAQRSAQSVENRRVQQEGSGRRGLPVEDLLGEVVDHEAVVAGEVGDEPGTVRPALQRQRRQLQRGNPALGTPAQRVDVTRIKLEAHRAVEIGGRFVVGETQVRGPNLRQLSAGPEPGQRQRGIGPARHDDVERRRSVLDQVGDRLVNVVRLDDVVVVQNEGDAGVIIQVVEKSHHHGGGGLGGLQRFGRLRADCWRDASYGSDDIRPKDARVVVATVQRQPSRHRRVVARIAEPVGQQGGLAEPGRGRHERDSRRGDRVRSDRQPPSSHDTRPRPWRMELCREQLHLEVRNPGQGEHGGIELRITRSGNGQADRRATDPGAKDQDSAGGGRRAAEDERDPCIRCAHDPAH